MPTKALQDSMLAPWNSLALAQLNFPRRTNSTRRELSKAERPERGRGVKIPARSTLICRHPPPIHYRISDLCGGTMCKSTILADLPPVLAAIFHQSLKHNSLRIAKIRCCTIPVRISKTCSGTNVQDLPWYEGCHPPADPRFRGFG